MSVAAHPRRRRGRPGVEPRSTSCWPTIVEPPGGRAGPSTWPACSARSPDPPFRKLGVFEVDAFFPEKDRTRAGDEAQRAGGLAVVRRLDCEGAPLDIGRHAASTPMASRRRPIVYLAHLSDSERQFVVTLFLVQAGDAGCGASRAPSDLRALVYMDEMFGFCPPTAEPPSKKPILTLLKQARAYGVGIRRSPPRTRSTSTTRRCPTPGPG